MYKLVIFISLISLAIVCVYLDHALYKTEVKVETLKKENQYWHARWIASLVMFGDDTSAKQAISTIEDPEVERRVIKQIWGEYNQSNQSHQIKETAKEDEYRYWRLKIVIKEEHNLTGGD